MLVGAAVAAYLPLIARTATLRNASLHFYLGTLLPIALLHIGLLILLALVSKRLRHGRLAPALFLVASSAALLLAGGGTQISAVGAVVTSAAVLALSGRMIWRSLLEPTGCHWGECLGFAILLASFGGAVLAHFGLLNRLAVLIGALLLIVPAAVDRAARGKKLMLLGQLEQVPGLAARLGALLALEGLFLVTCFVVIAASAPESRSDAIRFYWPYVKFLAHSGGLPDIPFQWPYIVPQPGLTYAATTLVMFGSRAVRLVMPLCLASLILMVARRATGRISVTGVAVALIVASSPVVLATSTSLMQDTFVSLATLLLAFVAIEGANPGSTRYWASLGALAGVCWTAKFSTLVYAAPLLLWALGRSWLRVGPKKSFIRLGIGATATCAAALPWLWQSYRESGNPVFPFLPRLFPAKLWPDGVPEPSGNLFPFPRGLKSLLTWPLDMTFHTDRFLEGFPGSLGLALIVLLLLAIPAVWKGPAKARGYAFAAFTGTATLWTMTAYVRYWLPGLWLLAAAAATGASLLAAGRLGKSIFAVIALVIVLLHVPMAMAHNWTDPQGLPWDYYSGAISREAYLRRSPGYEAFRRLESLGDGRREWAKVWFTGTEAVGHWNVVPLEASVWEFAIHRANDRGSLEEYLSLPGCEYWVVNTDSEAAEWFRRAGLADDYWTAARRVAADGPLQIYRLKSRDERAGSLERYLAKLHGGASK